MPKRQHFHQREEHQSKSYRDRLITTNCASTPNTTPTRPRPKRRKLFFPEDEETLPVMTNNNNDAQRSYEANDTASKFDYNPNSSSLLPNATTYRSTSQTYDDDDDTRLSHNNKNNNNNNNNTTTKNNKRVVSPSEEFRKLSKSDPVQLRRMQQRQRAVQYGKNTVGYDTYIAKIPKHKRCPRSLDHPSTPDHTIDMPNRRWQGQLKAWRKALHKFDPEDLLESSNGIVRKEEDLEVKEATAGLVNIDLKKKKKEDDSQVLEQTVQEKEIAEAEAKGLLVDFALPDSTMDIDDGKSSLDDTRQDTNEVDDMNVLDQLGNGHDGADDVFVDFSDSDDDLL